MTEKKRADGVVMARGVFANPSRNINVENKARVRPPPIKIPQHRVPKGPQTSFFGLIECRGSLIPVLMVHLFPVLLLFTALSCGAGRAQTTRADFLFALETAVKEGDREALIKCFHLEGANDATKKKITRSVDQICSWPTRIVFTTERTGTGPLRVNQDGKSYTLNGEWLFQVHLFLKKPPSKGFVFPAGTSNGKYTILTIVYKT